MTTAKNVVILCLCAVITPWLMVRTGRDNTNVTFGDFGNDDASPEEQDSASAIPFKIVKARAGRSTTVNGTKVSSLFSRDDKNATVDGASLKAKRNRTFHDSGKDHRTEKVVDSQGS